MKFKILPEPAPDEEPVITAELYFDDVGDLSLKLNGEHAANLIFGHEAAEGITEAIADRLSEIQ